MIDIEELRRLAQAATAGPWINHGRQPNVAGLPHSAVAAKTLLARVYSEAYGDVAQETANAAFIAAANPAAISELLDRLEAAEAEALEQARLNGMGSEREASLRAKLEAAERERDDVAQQLVQAELGKRKLDAERDALRAKVEAMEQQEPAAFALYSGWARKAVYLSELEACDQCDRRQLTADLGGSLEAYRVVPLYALPGAKGE